MTGKIMFTILLMRKLKRGEAECPQTVKSEARIRISPAESHIMTSMRLRHFFPHKTFPPLKIIKYKIK